MPDILVRGVDPLVIQEMKRAAAEQGLSMQALAKRTLERQYRRKLTPSEWVERAREFRRQFESRDFPDLVTFGDAEWEAWPPQ